MAAPFVEKECKTRQAIRQPTDGFFLKDYLMRNFASTFYPLDQSVENVKRSRCRPVK